MGSASKMQGQASCITCILVLCIPAILSDTEDTCPPGWLDGVAMDMGCLLFNTTTAYTWEEAYGFCKTSHNAALVEILTEDQFDFIRLELYDLEEVEGKTLWWTGAMDLGREGEWVWVGSLAHVGEFIWREGHPNGGVTDNCMYLNSGGSYEAYDNPCNIQYFPLCQKMLF